MCIAITFKTSCASRAHLGRVGDQAYGVHAQITWRCLSRRGSVSTSSCTLERGKRGTYPANRGVELRVHNEPAFLPVDLAEVLLARTIGVYARRVDLVVSTISSLKRRIMKLMKTRTS